ncbi:MAG: HD domain-containing phosphohydrolase, partial [Candidatus Methylomirabilales bacterium]
LNTLRSMVATLEARDEYTRNHSERVTRLATLIAKELGFPEQQMSALQVAGTLHDLGKIGVPGEILKSADTLSPERRRLMESYPEIGARIVEPIPFLQGVREIISQHQERNDGSGYPRKLKGEAIRPEARVLAVADTYDALICRRRERGTGFSHQEVLAELKRVAGAGLDPEAVAAFCRLDQAAVEALYPGLPATSEPRAAAPAPPPRPEVAAAPARAARPEVGAAPTPRPADSQDAVLCRCPKCQGAFRVRAAAIPAGGARIRCPRCKEVIPVRPPGGSDSRIAFVT